MQTDVKILAAKILIAEDQLEATRGIPDRQLAMRWLALLEQLRDATSSGPNPRRFLRIPVRAWVTFRRQASERPLQLYCEDISHAGCRVAGDTSDLQVGETIELVQLAHSSGVVEPATRCVVVWHKAEEGEAGLKFVSPWRKEFNELYVQSYKSFLNELAADGARAKQKPSRS